MKRLAALALFAQASATFARQTDSCPTWPGEQMPFIYLIDKPGNLSLGALGGYASVMVVAFADQSPQAAAAEVKSKADAQILAGVTDATRLCIHLLNFGAPSLNGTAQPNQPSSFFHVNDKLNIPNSDWPDPTNPPPQESPYRYMQPWLTAGIDGVLGVGGARKWMIDFLAAYDALGGIAPARFHFDCELSLADCCSLEGTVVMRAVAKDHARWINTVVPGTGGLTMATLYANAISTYGWVTGREFENALDPSITPSFGANRKYFIWYEAVCQKVRDAALKQAAYDVIHARWPNCKFSNYQDNAADGHSETFGWYAGRDANGTTFTPTMAGIRGTVDSYSIQGDLNIAGDLLPGTPYASLWHVFTGAASGDFSAPELYPCNEAFFTNPPRTNYYLSPDALGGNTLTGKQATLMVQRRTVESILNSPGGGPGKLTPWIEGLNGHPAQSPRPVEFDEFTNQLAMLRAKRLSEVLLWWDGNPDSQQNWPLLQNIFRQLYSVRLYGYKLFNGTALSPNTNPDRLRDTLRGTCEAFDCNSETLATSASEVTTIVGYYTLDPNWPPVSTWLNLECAVNDPAVRGTLWYWDAGHPPLMGWRPHRPDDDVDMGLRAPFTPWPPHDEACAVGRGVIPKSGEPVDQYDRGAHGECWQA